MISIESSAMDSHRRLFEREHFGEAVSSSNLSKIRTCRVNMAEVAHEGRQRARSSFSLSGNKGIHHTPELIEDESGGWIRAPVP